MASVMHAVAWSWAGREIRLEDWVVMSIQLQATTGLTTRLSVHLLPLSPLWTVASLVLSPAPSDCHASAVSPRRPSRAVCWAGGMGLGHGQMGGEEWIYRRKVFVKEKMSRLAFRLRRKMEMGLLGSDPLSTETAFYSKVGGGEVFS